VLGAEFRELLAVLANQHPRPKRTDTSEEVDKDADDHAAIVGTLTNGAVASVHLPAASREFRAGTGSQPLGLMTGQARTGSFSLHRHHRVNLCASGISCC
jgi:hypothetical protein